jgi:hypothetical protein
MEEVNPVESWNKKRIFIAIFLLLLLAIGGYLFKTRILGANSSQLGESVKGIATEEIASPEVKTNIQEAVREKIDNLKQEVSGLDIVEIASSSPQVQKILNDIKSLEQYPTNQLKEICRKICGL